MTPNPPPASPLYTILRGQVEHINTILSQRIIWLVIAQSFFFSGYAVLITGKPDTRWQAIHEKLLIIFPIASLLAVIFTFMDVIGSMLYLRKLRKWYADRPKDETSERNYPPMAGFRSLTMLENTSPVVLPLVFMVTWAVILFLRMNS
jgi:hypothetical protein